MTWKDFLRYSKYIAVFYALAFAFTFSGIWIGDINMRLLWSGVLCFGTALAANVALASYHYNHKGEMKIAKNEYLVEQDEAQVVTDVNKSKSLELRRTRAQADLDEHVRQIAREAVENDPSIRRW